MISVIVPMYNSEAMIEQCILSILAQTYRDFEVLVINDGSKDASAEIVALLAQQDARVRLINQDNAGVSAARNRGIREAKGEYLCFVDSDDYIEPQYLQILLDGYQTKGVPVVGFSINNADEPAVSNRIGESYTVGETLFKDYLVGDLGKTIAFSACNKLFVRELLVCEHIAFPVDLKIGEDMIFLLRYIAHCNTVQISSAIMYRYCVHKDSAIGRASNMAVEYEKTLCALKSLNENGWTFDDNTLSKWALEVMTYIVMNAYVAKMTYAQFKEYFHALKQYELYAYAIQDRHPNGIKRKWLRRSLAMSGGCALFTLIKCNCLLLRG